jgi:predicted oxidoreductase
MRPVTVAPFYGAEIRLASIALTGAGLQVNEEAEVLDVGGVAIPGLYAAGELTEGVIGDMYVTGGTSLTNGAVVGRIAGQSAAGRRPWRWDTRFASEEPRGDAPWRPSL